MPPMGASAGAAAAAAPDAQGKAPLLMGIDLSTQSVTVVIVEAGSNALLASDSLVFDAELPKYGTKNGMHVGQGRNGKVTQPVMMWLEGLDKVLRRQDRGLLTRVRAVSGSAQQHGSVFWNADGLQTLRSMNSEDSLAANLFQGFALDDSPIWADSSAQVSRLYMMCVGEF